MVLAPYGLLSADVAAPDKTDKAPNRREKL
jgi:hypothetical protein